MLDYYEGSSLASCLRDAADTLMVSDWIDMKQKAKLKVPFDIAAAPFDLSCSQADTCHVGNAAWMR